MLCVMEGTGDGQGDATSEFIASGRTGRRNAMPDILSEHAATTTADLPEALEKLSCSGEFSQHLTSPSLLHLLLSSFPLGFSEREVSGSIFTLLGFVLPFFSHHLLPFCLLSGSDSGR